MPQQYHPEPYWSEVAERISGRQDGNIIAGDDEPYYRYKRKKLVKWLRALNFANRSVLEVGCGPGGNLKEISRLGPARLTGVDISGSMITLAKANCPPAVEIVKIDGERLPFDDREFDITLTITVLQHNTDAEMLKKIMGEICRVTQDRVFLFERVDPEIQGDDLCLGRPVEYYADIMRGHGFSLLNKEHINIRASYYMAGAIRKGLNRGERREGEPISRISIALQTILLPVTSVLDKILTSRHDVAKLEFVRSSAASSHFG